MARKIPPALIDSPLRKYLRCFPIFPSTPVFSEPLVTRASPQTLSSSTLFGTEKTHIPVFSFPLRKSGAFDFFRVMQLPHGAYSQSPRDGAAASKNVCVPL